MKPACNWLFHHTKLYCSIFHCLKLRHSCCTIINLTMSQDVQRFWIFYHNINSLTWSKLVSSFRILPFYFLSIHTEQYPSISWACFLVFDLFCFKKKTSSTGFCVYFCIVGWCKIFFFFYHKQKFYILKHTYSFFLFFFFFFFFFYKFHQFHTVVSPYTNGERK